MFDCLNNSFACPCDLVTRQTLSPTHCLNTQFPESISLSSESSSPNVSTESAAIWWDRAAAIAATLAVNGRLEPAKSASWLLKSVSCGAWPEVPSLVWVSVPSTLSDLSGKASQLSSDLPLPVLPLQGSTALSLSCTSNVFDSRDSVPAFPAGWMSYICIVDSVCCILSGYIFCRAFRSLSSMSTARTAMTDLSSVSTCCVSCCSCFFLACSVRKKKKSTPTGVVEVGQTQRLPRWGHVMILKSQDVIICFNHKTTV